MPQPLHDQSSNTSTSVTATSVNVAPAPTDVAAARLLRRAILLLLKALPERGAWNQSAGPL